MVGNDAGHFSVGTDDGQITVAAGLDYETTTSYSLTVQASDGNGGTDTATVGIDVTDVNEGTSLTAPTAPTGFSSTSQRRNSVTLSWTTLTGADKYQVEYSRHDRDQWTLWNNNITSTSETVDDLACDTSYDFRLNAYGDGTTLYEAWGPFSNRDDVETALCAAQPPAISRAVTNTSVSVGWSSVPGATKYRARHRESGTNSWTESSDITGNSHALSGITAGTTYEIETRSYGDGTTFASGWGDWSTSLMTTTNGPDTPSGLEIDEARATTILLSSEHVDGAAKYQLRHRAQGTTSWTEGTETTRPSYTVTGLSPASNYQFQVRAEGDDTRYSNAWSNWSSSEDGRTASALGCTDGTAVTDHATNPRLVDDCSVLLGLKSTLASTANLNWASTAEISTWDGVTVSGTPQRVTAIQLPDESLDGSIPPGLGQLSDLQTLHLDQNQLTGTIPPEIGRISTLNQIRLATNDFSDCVPLILEGIADNDIDQMGIDLCSFPSTYEFGLLLSIVRNLAAEVDSAKRNSTTSIAMLNCVNLSGRGLSYDSIDDLLRNYRGTTKETMDQCDNNIRWFSEHQRLMQSKITTFGSIPEYSDLLRTEIGQRYVGDAGDEYLLKHFLNAAAEDSAPSSQRRDPSYPDMGYNCLPLGEPKELADKLGDLNCLIFGTNHLWWVTNGATFRDEINTSNHRYSWLSTAADVCTKFFDTTPPICEKHDVALASLQEFDGRDSDVEMDRTWNPKNKALADDKMVRDIKKYDCQTPSIFGSILCEHTSPEVLAEIMKIGISIINTKHWPITEEDFDSFRIRQQFMDCGENVIPTLEMLSINHVAGTDADYEITWDFETGCVPEISVHVHLNGDYKLSPRDGFPDPIQTFGGFTAMVAPQDESYPFTLPPAALTGRPKQIIATVSLVADNVKFGPAEYQMVKLTHDSPQSE